MSKLVALGIVWFGVIAAYIFMAAAMPALNSIITTSAAEMAATTNSTAVPGVMEATRSAPIWLWAIPGFVGTITTVIYLKKSR